MTDSLSGYLPYLLSIIFIICTYLYFKPDNSQKIHKLF